MPTGPLSRIRTEATPLSPTCACGRPADRGGYCSVLCELADEISEVQAGHASTWASGWEGLTTSMTCEMQYHGVHRRDDL